jgi:hypothetical protein
VHVVGSGMGVTILTGTGQSLGPGVVSLPFGLQNSSLRELTLQHLGGSTQAYAIGTSGGSPSSIEFSNVEAIASGATSLNVAIRLLTASSSRLIGVTATAVGGNVANALQVSGTGNYIQRATLTATAGTLATMGAELAGGGTIRDSVVSAASAVQQQGAPIGLHFNTAPDGYEIISSTISSTHAIQSDANAVLRVMSTTLRGTLRGMQIWGGSARVINSSISGTTNTVHLLNSAGSVIVGLSEMAGGPALVQAGTLTCAGVVDENGVFYANTIP